LKPVASPGDRFGLLEGGMGFGESDMMARIKAPVGGGRGGVVATPTKACGSKGD
jgi:hypothetical protein